MKTFIANFGRSNYLWPECREQAVIATFEDEDLRPFWVSGDREGYIAHAIAHKKSASGITPIKPVASRWFNLSTIISESNGDLWIHREKDELWWTITKPEPVQVKLAPSNEPERTSEQVYVIKKPAYPWSNKDKKGRPLLWTSLHPRAREFLFTEGTLQQVSEYPENNAAYARTLIEGDDLTVWHSQSRWKAKLEKSGKSLVTSYSSAERASLRMARTAMSTAANANGQEVIRNIKNKECRFESENALQEYLKALLKDQDNVCAISSLPLQFDGDSSDPEMLCSLDRIDSKGHYEEGNLQVVCRFINKWKSDSEDAEFRRLIRLVQSASNQTQ